MKGLIHEIVPVDSSEPAVMDALAVDPARIFDTVVAAYLLDSARSSFDDGYIADAYLGAPLPPAAGGGGRGGGCCRRCGALRRTCLSGAGPAGLRRLIAMAL